MSDHCHCCTCSPKNKTCDICLIHYTNKKHFYRTRLFKLSYPSEKRNVCRSCADGMLKKVDKSCLRLNSESVLVSFN